MASLGTILVSAQTFTYLGSVFTRDVGFSAFVFAAFWLFIFAPTYYALNVATYFFVPAATALAAVLGIAVVNLLSVGQLVDIWLTGSGGGDNSQHEELNVPFMVVAIGFVFFAVFFALAAVACQPADLTCANFLGGLFYVPSALVGWILFGVFAALALAAVLATGIQRKRGVRFKGIHDWASVYYFFAFLMCAALPALAWHLLYPSSFLANAVWRGWIAAAVAFVGDLIWIGLGVLYERQRDTALDNNGPGTPSTRHGRFYSKDANSGLFWVRYFGVPLVHAGFYILGGYAQSATVDDVAAMFWSPWFIIYISVGFVLFAGLYVIILVFFTWQAYFMDSTLSDAGDDDEERAVLIGNQGAARSGSKNSRSPPASPPAKSFDFDESGAPIAARTRRRAPPTYLAAAPPPSSAANPLTSVIGKLNFDM